MCPSSSWNQASSSSMRAERWGGRHHVVVVGAGYAGLTAAVELAREAPRRVRITLVDRNPFHLLKPRLSEAAIHGTDVSIPLRPFLAALPIEVVRAEVGNVDLERKRLVTGGSTIPFDTLVLATGAVPAFRDIPGLSEHALPLKSADQARRLHGRISSRFTAAAHVPDERASAELRRVLVLGGGFAGVEVALELASRSRESGDRAEVHLIEAGSRLLPWGPEDMSAAVTSPLLQLGVRVRVGAAVQGAERGIVHLEGGEVLRAGTLIWLGGVEATAPVGGQVERGRLSRVIVDETLRVPAHPSVYVAGDAGRAFDPDTGAEAPLTAALAVQEGRYVAGAILSRLRGRESAGFVPRIVPEHQDPDRTGEVAALGAQAAGQSSALRNFKRALSERHLVDLGTPAAA